MKKLIACALLGLPLCGALAQSSTPFTNAPSATYTNGLMVRVPLSDQQYFQLQYIIRSRSLTNMPPAQVLTNYMALDFNAAGKALLNSRRARIFSRLQGATDAQLSQVESALNPQP